ncbi:MAG: hypothetical protein ACKVOQ_14625 [Cyclobacteriaceae bacterium]
MKNVIKKLLFCLSIVSLSYLAQGQNKDIQIDLGTIKTELKQGAINLGINYVRSLDSLFKEQDILVANKNSLFQLTPQFNVQTGSGDAFSSISAKLTGLFMCFRDTTIAGVKTPNTKRGFQTFPISAGIESNNRFSVVNGIAEAGWVPWYQTQGNKKTPGWLKHTKFGVFLQGGYKFAIDTTGKTAIGGEKDQSKEKTDNAIFRTKARIGIDTKSIFELSGVGVGVVGDADGWYDFLNGQVYYTIQGKLRFYLTQDKDKFFDFKYQKGSGAPNFNQGDQYGMGLTVTF